MYTNIKYTFPIFVCVRYTHSVLPDVLKQGGFQRYNSHC
jgi:hypothetical protein